MAKALPQWICGTQAGSQERAQSAMSHGRTIMRHRVFVLCTMVGLAFLLVAGGTMVATGSGAQPASAAPGACLSNPLQASDASSSMEPVSCGPGCPTSTVCEAGGQPCGCPTGPGHCQICNPPGNTFKCVKD